MKKTPLLFFAYNLNKYSEVKSKSTYACNLAISRSNDKDHRNAPNVLL